MEAPYSLRRQAFMLLSRAFYRLESMLLPRTLAGLSYNRPRRIRVPTYDGSGQAVHPDILGPWQADGVYLLAFTPYPFTNEIFENPSVAISRDGMRFHEERTGLNPLAPAPTIDHNDDPDVLRVDGVYNLVYLETLRPQAQNLVLLQSRDRLQWSRRTLLRYDLTGPRPDPFIVSPSLVADDGMLRLFYVNTSRQPHRIEYLASRDVAAWSSADIHVPVFDRLAVNPWHVDVVAGNDGWYILITDVRGGGSHLDYDLYIARSRDLERWEMGRKVFARMPFASRLVYRSTALCAGEDLYIYFSCKSRFGEWKIGVVRKKIPELFPHG